jgi:hypothetical protein
MIRIPMTKRIPRIFTREKEAVFPAAWGKILDETTSMLFSRNPVW